MNAAPHLLSAVWLFWLIGVVAGLTARGTARSDIAATKWGFVYGLTWTLLAATHGTGIAGAVLLGAYAVLPWTLGQLIADGAIRAWMWLSRTPAPPRE
jgi:hypothetical membrane protein